MDNIADVLLLRAVQAWCEDCGAEQLLMPTDEDVGLCCTACDAAVFVVPTPVVPGPDQRAPLRRTA